MLYSVFDNEYDVHVLVSMSLLLLVILIISYCSCCIFYFGVVNFVVVVCQLLF